MASITLGHVKRNMQVAGVSIATLARVGGLAPSTLVNAFRDLGYLGAERERDLFQLTIHLLEIQDALKPLELPTAADDLRRLLNACQEQGVAPETIRAKVNEIFGCTE